MSMAHADQLGQFRQRLFEIAEGLGIHVDEQEQDQRARIRLQFAEYFPMWLTVDLYPETGVAFVVGVVRTMGLPGDRSDYHELISSIWAIALRSVGVASVRLVDIPHPVAEGELYGRYVLFEQPDITHTSLDDEELRSLSLILWASRASAQSFSALFVELNGGEAEEEYDWKAAEQWAKHVCGTVRMKHDHHDSNYGLRRYPNWEYFHRNVRGITAFRFTTPLLLDIARGLPSHREQAVVEHGAGLLLISPGIDNYIPGKVLATVRKLLKAYDRKLTNSLTSLGIDDNTILVPVESHVFCVTSQGIIAVECECGRREAEVAKASVRTQHRHLSSLLLPIVNFRWNKELNADRFELLILDLLRREPGVVWVRKVGHASAPDAERDLVVEWLLGPAPWQDADVDSPIERRRIIVQCKAYSKSVNLSKLPDVPVILDFHEADGYLLVAYPDITPQVVDYFKTVPARRGFWADWWSKSELEERLRSNTDVAARYPDLVTIEGVTPPSD